MYIKRMSKCTECGQPSRSKNGTLCEKHYMRWYRHKSFEKKRQAGPVEHSHGYILVPAEEHPLREGKAGKYEYEHRVTYYDGNGQGPFPCYWCGKTVTWSDLHIDHLNDDKKDNSLSNLAASCPTCNQARGRDKQRRTMIRKVGVLYEYKGVKETAGYWAELAGISRTSFRSRIRSGWSVADAVETPRGKTGPRP